ncbi:retinol dehydrogenase 16-like [Onychomys torridus]|uniref:retinol dehydrogenase 16-like n=1 Tax=Onychomys torridus TaxID=38674 RepID=UPI00167F788A|nr:retinol dehydrogenase 16-like [Onychomys torridus]
MWLYLVVLLVLWTLLRLFRERQVVSHLQDKHVFITGCDSGFGNLLARQLDRRGMRVLAACLTENGAEELRSKTSDRLETVILDVTKTESISGYCISKYGVEAFSDSLRRELSYFGVKVAIIEPGGFKTCVTSSDRISPNMKMVWDQASPEVKEIYGEKFLLSYLSVIKLLDQNCSEDLSLVTDCMEHALTSRHPRTRYSAGWDAKLLFLPVSYLPTFLVDAMFYWISTKPDKAL